MVHKLLDAAGFTDMKSQLGKAVRGAQIAVPPLIRLDGGALTWSPGLFRYVDPKPQILHSFVELWCQPPKHTLRFASKWGPLFIGDDGQLGARWASIYKPRTEQLEVWRYFSRRASAVLSIAAKVKEDSLGDFEEWRSFQNLNKWAPHFLEKFMDEVSPYVAIAPAAGYWLGAKDPSKRNLESERIFLWCEAELWLRLGKVRFGLEPKGDSFALPWELKISYGSGVLGAIALQLALTLCDVNKLFTCSGCGLPYRRDTRRPRSDQANFCKKCRATGTPLKKADERRRQKKVDAHRLSDEGFSVQEIATQLATKVTTIRVWLKKRGKAS